MSGSIVAKRYANALYQVAYEQNLIDQVGADLVLISETLRKTPEFQNWLSLPNVGIESKKELIGSVLSDIQAITKNFFFVLIDSHRENIITDVVNEYIEIADEGKGIVEVLVTSATPLSIEDKTNVTKTFHEKLGKKIRLKENVDASILGGMVVQVKDHLYDGSLKNKLDRFQTKLKETRVG